MKTPWDVQAFVFQIPYNPKSYSRSAERVLRDRTAHCFEGALLAALLLEKMGHEARLLHLRSHRDDDHVVTLFQVKGNWGAVGKSNTTLLAWREPIYPDLKSLAASYFPFYFNLKGQMSLTSWAGPIRLDDYKKWNWRSGAGDIGDMSAAFYRAKNEKIMSAQAIEKLPPAPIQLVKACFLGANKKGLYSV